MMRLVALFVLLLTTAAVAADPQPTPAAAVAEATPTLDDLLAAETVRFQQLIQERQRIDNAMAETRGRAAMLEQLGAKAKPQVQP